MKKKSTYSVGEKVQVRLYIGDKGKVWLSGEIIETGSDTYSVQLDSGRVVRDIEPEDLRKG